MARLFTAASSEFLENTTAVATAVPLTFACWFFPANTNVTKVLMSISASATANGWALTANLSDTVQASSTASGANVSATSGTYAVSTWAHAAGVFASATSRTAYFNGVAGTANTTSNTPGGTINRTTIGRNSANSVATPSYMSGRIAEAAMWNVALTSTEIAALAGGIAPPYTRPASLIGYWPIWGLHSPEIDLDSTPTLLTVTGTSQANHAPVTPFTHRTRSLPVPQFPAAAGLLPLSRIVKRPWEPATTE